MCNKHGVRRIDDNHHASGVHGTDIACLAGVLLMLSRGRSDVCKNLTLLVCDEAYSHSWIVSRVSASNPRSSHISAGFGYASLDLSFGLIVSLDSSSFRRRKASESSIYATPTTSRGETAALPARTSSDLLWVGPAKAATHQHSKQHQQMPN